jgi:hypothetical protein
MSLLMPLLLLGQNHRDEHRRARERRRRHPPPADESRDARSQRRFDQSITSQRACRYEHILWEDRTC